MTTHHAQRQEFRESQDPSNHFADPTPALNSHMAGLREARLHEHPQPSTIRTNWWSLATGDRSLRLADANAPVSTVDEVSDIKIGEPSARPPTETAGATGSAPCLHRALLRARERRGMDLSPAVHGRDPLFCILRRWPVPSDCRLQNIFLYSSRNGRSPYAIVRRRGTRGSCTKGEQSPWARQRNICASPGTA